MNIVRLIAYLVALGLIAFADLSLLQINILLYLYLGSLYIEAKDSNIRSLIFLLLIVQVIFDQLDWITFVICKYYIDVGPLAGNAILNGVIMINFLVLIHCIYFRCEIMNWATKFFGMKEFLYLPIKADIIQMNVIRLISLYTIYYILFSAFDIIEINNIPINKDYDATYNDLMASYRANGSVFVEINRKLEVLRHGTLVLLLHSYLKQIDKKRIFRA